MSSFTCYTRYSSLCLLVSYAENLRKWASAWDFQQCGIFTCVDSDGPLQPSFVLRNSKWCSVSSLTIIEYSSDQQRLWSDCAYVQADLRLCWSHIPHGWKSHALAQIVKTDLYQIPLTLSWYAWFFFKKKPKGLFRKWHSRRWKRIQHYPACIEWLSIATIFFQTTRILKCSDD